MLRGRLGLLAAIVASACAPAVTAGSRAPIERVSLPRARAPAPEDPTTRLVFESAAAVTIDGNERLLDTEDPRGAAVLAGVAGNRGVVVPLATIVSGDAPRHFVIEPTPWCSAPWIIDLDAPLLTASTSLRGAPAALRAGCGALQHADFVTAMGRERVVVYGEAPFDPRLVASEMGIIRTDLERMFDVQIAELWTNEVVVAPLGTVGAPQADANPRGLRLRLDAGEPWAALSRLEVGATISRIWLGQLLDQLALSERADVVTLGRAALLHGVGRGIARESLFELGLLSPDDYAADLDRAEALLADRAHAWRPAGAIDARDVAARAAAASIDAAILAWALREGESPLTLPQALREVGPGAGEDAVALWSGLVAGLRPRRLGACILPRSTKSGVVELGIHTPWDPEHGVARVTALMEDGAAMRAGVLPGDTLVRVATAASRTVMTLARGERTVELAALVRPEQVARRGWIRRRDVADERCYPRL